MPVAEVSTNPRSAGIGRTKTQSKVELGRDSNTGLRAQSAPHEQRKPDQERAGAEVDIGLSNGFRFAGIFDR